MFCSFCCKSKYFVRDQYFGRKFAQRVGTHLHPGACYIFSLSFWEESKHTHTIRCNIACFYSNYQQWPANYLFHLPLLPSISLCPTIPCSVHRLRAHQSWSFDGNVKRRPCVGFNTSRQQHINHEVPGMFCVTCLCSASWCWDWFKMMGLGLDTKQRNLILYMYLFYVEVGSVDDWSPVLYKMFLWHQQGLIWQKHLLVIFFRGRYGLTILWRLPRML